MFQLLHKKSVCERRANFEVPILDWQTFSMQMNTAELETASAEWKYAAHNVRQGNKQ